MAIPFLMLPLFFMLAHSQDPNNGTSFAFGAFVPSPTDLLYQGDAHVPQNTQYLRLTKTDDSGTVPGTLSAGRVLYSNPIHFWETSPAAAETSFETTINFSIKPSSGGAADGLAFFIAPVDSPMGDSGSSFGIFGRDGTASSVFAVEFDTYANSGYDPDYLHIGIDVNSRRSLFVTPFDAGTGERVTAVMNYDSTSRLISVKATAGSRTAQFSYVLDLKTVVNQWVRVGISSSTGPTERVLGISDIYSWSFNSTLLRTNANANDDGEAYVEKYASA